MIFFILYLFYIISDKLLFKYFSKRPGYMISLKAFRKEALSKDMELIEKIQKSEKGISEGKFVKADSKMRDEDIDDLLM